MKKITISLLIVFCVLIFCSCSEGESKEQGNPSNEAHGNISEIDPVAPVIGKTEPNKDPAGDVGKIRGIFLENLAFFDVGSAEKISIDELSRSFTSDETVEVTVSRFTVIDLDNDGMDEVVLWLTVDGNEYFGCEILHSTEEEVYGFFVPYRGFNSLKTDGTFSFSGGAGNSGFGTIKFTSQEYTVEKITFCETRYDEKNEAEVSFVVNGHEATQEEFERELEIQNEKQDAETYSYSEENVKEYIS